MLEQLVESKNNSKENRTRGGFIFTTLILVVGLCFSAILSSLFAMNLNIGGEDLELSMLVAPIAPVEAKPEPVEQVKKQENQSTKAVTETTRQTNTLRMIETPIVPTQISVVPNTQKARPVGEFKISDIAETSASRPSGDSTRETSSDGIDNNNTQSKLVDDKDTEDVAVVKKAVVEPKKTVVSRISKGVVNGQATSLPKPVYSAAAKAVRASGEVSVQILIDKNGNVVSAKAVSGHALLRTEAERAAKSAKFNPTKLSEEPVEVTGVIVYKFVLP
jgi:protein TonB